MKKSFLASMICLLVGSSVNGQNKIVLVEAERFEQTGGWVNDHQLIDQIGSSYLLAHGMGVPVKDAQTSVILPAKGTWHLFARTWNWNAPWNPKAAPGRFQIKINGTALKNELGLGKRWDWEYAGSVEVGQKGSIQVALHDLTGFEGRCDAIVFSQSAQPQLPNEMGTLCSFRKKCMGIAATPKKAGRYDLVVVGGGLAGLSAAVAAARQGATVAVINNRPVPGGNNSKEIGIVASGDLMWKPYERLGEIMDEIGNIYQDSNPIERILSTQQNLSYFHSMHVFEAKREGNRIVSVTARHIDTAEEMSFEGSTFADCSGDGNLGFLAGADFTVGREARSETREPLAPEKADNLCLGSSIYWKSKQGARPSDFPACNWAVQFTDDSCEPVFESTVFWESGFRLDQMKDAEYIRDYIFRAIYGNWSFMKNFSEKKEEYTHRSLSRIGYVLGKRESRRLLGDVLFTQMDIEGDYVKYDDAMVLGTYPIDQHLPEPKNTFYFPGNEFLSTMKHNYNDMGISKKYLRPDQVNPPYFVPYRCLYSRNIENMFMAGRNASVSHIALCSTRVQGTTGLMGELVGYAASLCKKYNCTPRQVYEKHLDELKAMATK